MQALLRRTGSRRAPTSTRPARTCERAEENYAARIIPEADMQRARTGGGHRARRRCSAAERRVEQARATLEGARDTLSKTTVRSPIDGIVTAKRVEEGEVAVIGVQNQPGHGAAHHLRHVGGRGRAGGGRDVDPVGEASGQEARVRIDAYPNQTFKGVVTEVGRQPHPAGRAAPARTRSSSG